ncbi:hypothetical protein [Methanosarcina barkeri]|nr:hypothetical protein [Methanosarcina barkeri]
MELILREKGADIPFQGTVVEPDGPLTSLFACTSTREKAIISLEKGANRIRAFIENQLKREDT